MLTLTTRGSYTTQSVYSHLQGFPSGRFRAGRAQIAAGRFEPRPYQDILSLQNPEDVCNGYNV